MAIFVDKPTLSITQIKSDFLFQIRRCFTKMLLCQSRLKLSFESRFVIMMFEVIMQTFYQDICTSLGIEPNQNPKQLSPLVLAFVGDAVFDLAVRAWLAQENCASVHTLHVEKAKRVRAAAQAEAANAILTEFTPEEEEVFRRGRNSKPGTIPKHASLADYAAATGLEAVIGFLFLSKQEERMLQLIQLALEAQTIEKVRPPKAYKK